MENQFQSCTVLQKLAIGYSFQMSEHESESEATTPVPEPYCDDIIPPFFEVSCGYSTLNFVAIFRKKYLNLFHPFRNTLVVSPARLMKQ